MNDLILLKISIQRALLGYLTPDVRSVNIKIIEKIIYLYIVIDGKPSEYWIEAYTMIGTEVIADFSDEFNIEENLLQIDYPNLINIPNTELVYLRYESPDLT
ncbi:hypothetical protein B9T24_16350 [Acinetobacter sp. ANC 4654]|uniref:hypothetical protein n=1 Tax=Acinetobacter sp. ANC 4654 TaxID=1977872 RepID=UPI000A33F60E|nr:hypothetical protein [Acinetobacter sp. ANC 4654]OTG90594.1 hypothetical protein B9T24_16350 [Acinetobacter sp. ANC 4654]